VTSEEVLELLKKCGAVQEGHFLLTSGLHSNMYVEKFNVLQHPAYTEKLCGEFAARFKNDGIQVVVGPVTGGIILAHETGKQLGCRAIFTEREKGAMTLRRGFKVARGEKALVVEDIVTTGGSIAEVIKVLKEAGADVVGAGIFVERAEKDVDLGVRKEVLLKLTIPAWEQGVCPLCMKGMAIVKPGSRKT
jgi:orotate phosphoribosyltransferase